jgi:alkylhydroperoxidase family enzyme
MPYRIDVAEGEEGLEVILNKLGTPLLVETRKRMFRVIYDAPETTLSPREREVMRFPMTAMMGCPICNSVRMWRDWPNFSAEPIEEELYTNAEAFNYDWAGFSERERLVLEFINRFANEIDGLNGDDLFWERMHTHFSQAEIGDIVLMAGTWLGVGHGLKALGIGSVCPLPVNAATLRKLRNDDLVAVAG